MALHGADRSRAVCGRARCRQWECRVGRGMGGRPQTLCRRITGAVCIDTSSGASPSTRRLRNLGHDTDYRATAAPASEPNSCMVRGYATT